MTWAFSDESERAATVLFGVMLVEPSAAAEARKALRNLLLPGQRRVHTAKESPRRRRQLLEVVADIEAESVVFTLCRPPGLHSVAARSLLLAASARLVIDRGAAAWYFDRQEPAQAARDRQVVESHVRAAAREIIYDHRPASDEPLLWAIDAVLWAVGTGGDWRRRIDARVRVVELHP